MRHDRPLDAEAARAFGEELDALRQRTLADLAIPTPATSAACAASPGPAAGAAGPC